jgi:hypothetical protein
MISRQELRTGDRVFFSAHANSSRRRDDAVGVARARPLLGFAVVLILAAVVLWAIGGTP